MITILFIIFLFLLWNNEHKEGFDDYWEKISQKALEDTRQRTAWIHQRCSPSKQCAKGLHCASDGYCRRDRVYGESCSPSKRCREGLKCYNGTCIPDPSFVKKDMIEYQFSVLLSDDRNQLRIQSQDYAKDLPGLTLLCFDRNRNLLYNKHYPIASESSTKNLIQDSEQWEKDDRCDLMVFTLWGIEDYSVAPDWKMKTLLRYYGGRLISYIDNNWLLITRMSTRNALYEDVSKTLSYINTISYL